jgi:hypothetical protein
MRALALLTMLFTFALAHPTLASIAPGLDAAPDHEIAQANPCNPRIRSCR